jgi:acyl-coenzyme A thioesterase PaaI-like protein
MTQPPSLALQDRFAPQSHCFGCGPQNIRGLRLKSYPTNVDGHELLAEFKPEPHHEAFDGVVNGGIVGALLDCHSAWACAYALMRQHQLAELPAVVTADFHVTLRSPTPSNATLALRAWPETVGTDRCTVVAELAVAAKVTARCRGTFVAVKPGHPAYHRWT